MPRYNVTLRSNGIHTYYEVFADTFDEAQIRATSYAHQDGFESPSVVTVTLIEEPVDVQEDLATSGYSSYSAHTAPPTSTESSTYTSYSSFTTSEASTEAEEEVATSTYTPYSSVAPTPSEVAQAGFTATQSLLSLVPVSYHSTFDNGYAPYRSFRLKLPKPC